VPAWPWARPRPRRPARPCRTEAFVTAQEAEEEVRPAGLFRPRPIGHATAGAPWPGTGRRRRQAAERIRNLARARRPRACGGRGSPTSPGSARALAGPDGTGRSTPQNGKTRRLSPAGLSACSRAAERGPCSRFPVNLSLTRTTWVPAVLCASSIRVLVRRSVVAPSDHARSRLTQKLTPPSRRRRHPTAGSPAPGPGRAMRAVRGNEALPEGTPVLAFSLGCASASI